MENETKQTNTNEQEPDIFAQKLREADSLYAILSGCTKEPYVYCDPETMDDAPPRRTRCRGRFPR